MRRNECDSLTCEQRKLCKLNKCLHSPGDITPARVTACYDSPVIFPQWRHSPAGVLSNTLISQYSLHYHLHYHPFQVCQSSQQIQTQVFNVRLSDDGKTQERESTRPRPIPLQLRWSGGWRRWRTVSGVGQGCLCCWQPWSSWQEDLEQVSSDFFIVGRSWGVNAQPLNPIIDIQLVFNFDPFWEVSGFLMEIGVQPILGRLSSISFLDVFY